MHSRVYLPPLTTVGVFVDFQEEHRTHDGFQVHDYERVIQAAARARVLFKAAQIPLVYGQFVRRADGSNTPSLERETGGPAYSTMGVVGTAICRELEPTAPDVVAQKCTYSCFSSNAFKKALKRLDATHLVVCGVWTDACVRATVLDAMLRGIRVLLIKDACGSGTQFMHHVATLDMANRLYGGAITDLDRLETGIPDRNIQSWTCTKTMEFLYQQATVDALYAEL